MKLEYIKSTDNWREVANHARTTISMDKGKGEPSDSWKTKMLYAEHSPIRDLWIKWKWVDMKYWVSNHFVRHHIGFQAFVSSQRSDREHNNIYNRDKRPQDALVNVECVANTQSMINISRKRLCNQAHKETQQAWDMVIEGIKNIESQLYKLCVPECVYRGFCPEFKTCGFADGYEFSKIRKNYINNLNSARK